MEKEKKNSKQVIKEILSYVIIFIVVFLIKTYIVTPVRVVGDSMNPNLHEGEILILNRFQYRISDIERGQVVVVKHGGEPIIKRVIGLPGEHISYKDNQLYINGKKYNLKYDTYKTDDFTLEDICSCSKIPSHKYLVLGDNRPNSLDSRIIGLIDESEIMGKASFRLWPFSSFGSLK